MNDFEAAVLRAVRVVPPAALMALADGITIGSTSVGWAGPGVDQLAAVTLAARSFPDGPQAAAAYLRGAAAGYNRRAAEQQIELVWGGPPVHAVPTRSLSQVLLELIGGAQKSLLLMTYSAKPHPPVIAGIAAALARGASVSVVIETLAGAGSAISGDEPAAAFLGLPGIDLWQWPKSARPTPGAKMHAKLALADERRLLVGSANLTASGIDQSMEAAVLVTGGDAPKRAAALFRLSASQGQLIRLS